MFRASTHLTNARRFFNCISSTVYRCPYSHAVLNADGHVYAVTCVHLFYLFLTQVFAPFHICASLFSATFYSFFPFFKVLFLYPIFTRTLVIALNIFLLRASIGATIRLSLSVFIRPNPCATSGFLQLIYLLTPPEW